MAWVYILLKICKLMKYSVKRFSVTGYTQSEEIHEETVNGKTTGEMIISRGKTETGKKPVRKTLVVKYRKGGRHAQR